MTLQQLKDELLNDPENIGYAAQIAVGNHSGVAELINNKTFTAYRPITSRALLLWAAKTGCHYKLVVASTTHPVEQIKAICVSALKILDRDGTMLDLDDPDTIALLDALVAGSVFTAGDKTSLLASGTVGASRAEKLWGLDTSVSHSQITEALRLE